MNDTRIFKTLLKWALPFTMEEISERNKEDYNAYQKAMLTVVLCFSVIIFSSVFVVITLTYANRAIAIMDSIVCFLTIVTYLYFRKSGNLRITGKLIILISSGLLFFLIINGGVIKISYMWSFLFPIMALLFNGAKRGSIIAIIYLIIADALLFFKPFSDNKSATSSFIFIAIFSGIYLMVLIMCFFFEYTHSEAVRKLKKQNHRLAITIADLNATRKELKEAHDELEVIFENSMTGIAFLKNGRKIAAINKRLCGILGYTPAEAMKQSIEFAHVSHEAYLKFGEVYFKKLEKGELYNVQIQLKKKDGALIWCRISGSAINPHNLDDGVIWIVDDITERIRDKEELLKLERETAILAMIVTANHEINQPLTVVLGNLNLLELSLGDRGLSEKQCKYLARIKLSIDNIDRILKKYRDAESIEIGAYINDVKMVLFPKKYGSEVED